jgi:uncharacterized protein YkwD
MRIVSVILLALGLMLPGSGASAQTVQCADASGLANMTTNLVNAVNRERRAAGLSAVTQDTTLAGAARAHGCDMVVRNFFSHTGSDGSNAQTRIARAGYRACFTAENLALGQTGVAQVMTDWMNSPGHRANILHQQARHIGISVVRPSTANGPLRWVMVFGAPC